GAAASPGRSPAREQRPRRSRRRPRGGPSRRDPQAGEQVMSTQILERRELFSHRPNLLDRERAAISVERRDGFPQTEITGWPGGGTRERAAEEPVRRPAPEPADRGQTLDHLVVRERPQAFEIEFGAGEPEEVLRLPLRESDSAKLVDGSARNPF